MTTRRATAHFLDIGRLYIGWPTRADTWRNGGLPAQKAVIEFARLVLEHTQSAKVVLVVGEEGALGEVEASVRILGFNERLSTIHIPFDDCWLQDIGPVFARNDKGIIEGISFSFNGWGGGVCYSDYTKDVNFALRLCQEIDDGIECRKVEINLEGGAISTNGIGTAILTRECVQHRGMDENQVEHELEKALGIETIHWIPYGAIHDGDTNGHVDNMAIFTAENRILLQISEDDKRSKAALNAIKDENDNLEVYLVNAPNEVTRTAAEAAGVCIQKGSRPRPEGEPLCASYTNVVVVENKVFAPSFGVPQDVEARAQIARAFNFPVHHVVQVPAREFILAGGGLHCISLAMPKNK